LANSWIIFAKFFYFDLFFIAVCPCLMCFAQNLHACQVKEAWRKGFEFKLYLQMLSTMRPLPALSISVECRRRTEEIKKKQKNWDKRIEWQNRRSQWKCLRIGQLPRARSEFVAWVFRLPALELPPPLADPSQNREVSIASGEAAERLFNIQSHLRVACNLFCIQTDTHTAPMRNPAAVIVPRNRHKF